jgi:imidazolonepropionase-like amidohydrolase
VNARAALARAVPLLLVAPLALAQEKPQAFLGARIIPIAGPEIPKGVLVVRQGKIVAVGPEGTSIPEGSVRVDLSGKVLMPGLVDTHSHVGSVEGADASAPLQPDVRALDAIDVRDARLQKARAGGITTVNVMPGSGHLLSGQTVYLKLREGRTVEELLLPNPKTGLLGGMKMANGTNSRRKPPFPGTRAKSAALVREQYVKAQEYRQKIKDAGDDPKKLPARDLGMEGLLEVMDGKRMVHHHTHRHDDIVTVLRLQKEFGFRVTLHHVSEAWKVADEIAAAGVACSIINVDSPGGKLETMDLAWKTGAVLEKAGALVGFHTDDPITESRFFLRSAGLAVRAGMSREKALQGLTQAGAIILDLKDRVGSLAPGKDADFLVLSGDPLDYRTHVLETWVEGAMVFDLSREKDRLYAVGGYGAGHGQPPAAHLCGDFEDEEQGR